MMETSEDTDDYSHKRSPLLVVAEAEVPVSGQGEIVRRLLWAPSEHGSIILDTTNWHYDSGCSCNNYCNSSRANGSSTTDSRVAFPLHSTLVDTPEGEGHAVVDPICSLSSYEDTLVLASSSSLHIVLRQVEGKELRQVDALLQHPQQRQASRQYGIKPQLPPRIEFRFDNVATRTAVVSVACGLNHILVATAAGIALALGVNSQGQLGDGSFASKTTFTPVRIERSYKPVSVHAGRDFSIAICRSGRFPNVRTHFGGQEEPNRKRRLCEIEEAEENGGDVLFAWGSNEYGQLGQEANFTSRCSCMPIRVQSPIPNAIYTDAACASGHAIVLTADGVAVSFGLNIHGQLGNGSLTPKAAPGLVSVPFPLRSISCSDCRVLAVSDKGDVLSWGVEPAYHPPPDLRFPNSWPGEQECPTNSDSSAAPDASIVESLLELENGDTATVLLAERGTAEIGIKSCAAEQGPGLDPFFHSPGLHRVTGLPGGVSEIATGMCLSCAVCTIPASGRHTICAWHSSVRDVGHESIACRTVADLPSTYTEQKKRVRKLKWHCSCSRQNVLLWARAEA